MNEQERTKNALELYEFIDDYYTMGLTEFYVKYPEYKKWHYRHILFPIEDYLYETYIKIKE